MANNGKEGERLFKERMSALGYAVQNVSNDEEYFYKGDMVVTSPTSGLTKIFEVKWDTRINSTGNLYLELTNVRSKGGRGWFNFCEADYVAYGDAQAKCFYIIPLAALKERVKTSLRTRYTQCGADSTALLVAIADIQDLISIL